MAWHLWWLIPLAFVLLLLTRLLLWRRWSRAHGGAGCGPHRHAGAASSRDILDRRLALGEITPDEHRRLREHIAAAGA